MGAELLKRYLALSGLLTKGTLAVNEEYVDGVETISWAGFVLRSLFRYI